jgi:hypothetical protein
LAKTSIILGNMCIHMHISIYFISTRITIKRILAFYQIVDPENQKCAYIIHSFSNVRRLNANVTQKDGFPSYMLYQKHGTNVFTNELKDRPQCISQALLLAITGMLTYY